MIRITPKERAIIKLLVDLKSKDRHTVEISEVGTYLYENELGPRFKKPENWRQSLSSTLRNLGWKANRKGAEISRTSGLGRGNWAIYKFGGNLETMIKKDTDHGRGEVRQLSSAGV